MADRFDEVAMPLLNAGLLTSRGLALNLRGHIPINIREVTMSTMRREDLKRIRNGDSLMDKNELIAIAQDEKGFLLKFDVEMQVAGQGPDPRPKEEAGALHYPEVPPRPPQPMAERLHESGTIKECGGARFSYLPAADSKEGHLYH